MPSWVNTTLLSVCMFRSSTLATGRYFLHLTRLYVSIPEQVVMHIHATFVDDHH